jgi:hypothetical protein
MLRSFKTIALLAVTTVAAFSAQQASAIELLVTVAPDQNLRVNYGSTVINLNDPSVNPMYLIGFRDKTLSISKSYSSILLPALQEKSMQLNLWPTGSAQRQMLSQSIMYYQVAAHCQNVVVSLNVNLSQVVSADAYLENIAQQRTYQNLARTYTQLAYTFSPWKTSLDAQALNVVAPTNKKSVMDACIDQLELFMFVHDEDMIIAIL